MKLNTIAFFVIFIIGGLFAQQISLIEYFFDQDPGYGSGKKIVFTQGQNVDINASLDLSSLQKGYHTLFIRTKDTYGRWSISFVKQFYIIGITNQPQISKLEYFFDQDPGYGKGNNLQITPSQDISNNFMIDLSNLSEGQHNLYVRAMDNNGNWSISYSKLFFVTKNANDPQNKITSINYYFVKDSTKSNTFSYSNFAASANADINFNLDLSQLQENAAYQVKLSAVDQSGNVSIPYFTNVTVTPSTTNLTLLSPNGGEEWQVGSNHDIQWTSSNIDSIKIEFSSNNGNDWNLVATDIQASQNKYSWIVPDVISQSSKVKIISLTDTTYFDQSDSTFSIISDSSSPGWTYTITGNNHIILIPTSANPNISDTTLSSGDYIGAFYDSSGVLACAGYAVWDGTKNIAVTAWGDDNSTTNIKEGFAEGETFKWKIWQKKSVHVITGLKHMFSFNLREIENTL